jgi:hypothetical protein
MKIGAWITWRELAVHARTEGKQLVYVACAFRYQSIITGCSCALCVQCSCMSTYLRDNTADKYVASFYGDEYF